MSELALDVSKTLHSPPLGICDAFRDSELLADAIGDGLSGRRPMLEALADFQRRRDAASAADYDANVAEARFTPPRRLAQ